MDVINADDALANMSPLIPTTTTESYGFHFIGNMSHETTLEDLTMDTNMIWLLSSLVSAMLWVIYISFYNSRVVGYFVTKLVNRFSMKGVYFKIGKT